MAPGAVAVVCVLAPLAPAATADMNTAHSSQILTSAKSESRPQTQKQFESQEGKL